MWFLITLTLRYSGINDICKVHFLIWTSIINKKGMSISIFTCNKLDEVQHMWRSHFQASSRVYGSWMWPWPFALFTSTTTFRQCFATDKYSFEIGYLSPTIMESESDHRKCTVSSCKSKQTGNFEAVFKDLQVSCDLWSDFCESLSVTLCASVSVTLCLHFKFEGRVSVG